SQSEYPADYFRNPLDIPVVLAGTFGELRSNHFHSGLDIKTQGKEGLSIYATAEGYISRIKVEHGGYGKAIYINHPNGYTTVYAHLQKFSPRIEKFIKDTQYLKENYELDIYTAVDEFPVTKGEIIALSGNTGSSAGPHLHYEIRDNIERPINPLLFGMQVPDNKPPTVVGVYAYPLGNKSHINQSVDKRVKLRLIPTANGNFTTEKLQAAGNIGFGVISHDKLDMANNPNGLDNIQSFYNGNKIFEIDFRKFSFNETGHLNSLIDYAFYTKERERIQRLFVEPNNTLSMYKELNDNGILTIKDSTSSVYKIKLSDFAGNESVVTIPINGKEAEVLDTTEPAWNLEVSPDSPTTIEEGNYRVFIPANSVYTEQLLNFEVVGDTLKLHEDVVPLRKSYTLEYDISNYQAEDRDKLFLANLYGYYKKPNYIRTRRTENKLVANPKSFGTYTLAIDTIPPTIKPVNFQNNKWISNLNELVVEIEDDLSGIGNYRATVNGKWILMEYDYKK
ncbi:MAG: M23 family metallopeptidase, partial [Christiangramia sp.]|nr:M23 family metallopeptidase [Christiangramia sp.]